jgi:hypothetical protein
MVVALLLDDLAEYEEVRSRIQNGIPDHCERINSNSCCSGTIQVNVNKINSALEGGWLNTGIWCSDNDIEHNTFGLITDDEFFGFARTIELKEKISDVLQKAMGLDHEIAIASSPTGAMYGLWLADSLFHNTCRNTVNPSCRKVTQQSLCSDPASDPGKIWIWKETKSKWCKSNLECGC